MSGLKHLLDGTVSVHPKDVGVENSQTFKDRCEDITTILEFLANRAAKLIDNHEIFDEDIQSQLAALRESARIRGNERVKIGIVGASEMGKSSTLNALIHQRDLCKTDAGIEGCTSATCEVTGSEPGQTAPYVVNVAFYYQEEISKMLSEYIDDFCRFHFDVEDLAVCSAEERQKLDNSSTTLVQLMTTLLLKGPKAQTEEDIAKDLQMHYEQKTIKQYKATMAKECCRLIRGFAGGSGHDKSFTFQNIDETTAFAHPLGSTDDPDGPSRSMWPLVKRIRICVKDHILLQDIIIGDAPGISDINHCRVRNSYEYLDTCDFLMVVTAIQTRMASDVHVDTVLKEYGERFDGKLLMVVTRADEPIENKQMGRLLKKAARMGMISTVNQYRAIIQEIKDVKDRVKGRKLKPFEKFQVEEELKPLQQRQYETSVEVRSEVFRVKLLQKKGINVPMIFVSNKHYWRHSDNEDESEEMQSNDSTLGLPATGIPFLRRLLTSLPMKVVFRSLDEYRQRFISLTEALQTVVERETPKDPVLMKHLTDSLMAAAEKVSVENPFEYAVSQHFVQALMSNVSTFRDKAEDFFRGLPNVHWATIRAIINRKGVFKGSSKIRHDWPQSFTDCAVSEVNQAFLNMEAHKELAVTNYADAIEGLINEFAMRISASKHDLGITEQALHSMIGTFKRLVELHLESFKEKYEKAVANTKLNATKSRDSNFFGQSLLDLYEKTEDWGGTGYKNKIIAECQDYVDPEADNVITPSLKMLFDSLRLNKSEHVTALDAENMREVRFLCSKLTCTMESGGAFEAAQVEGRRFLRKAKGKGIDFIERSMQSLKDDIDGWVTKLEDNLRDDPVMPVDADEDGAEEDGDTVGGGEGEVAATPTALEDDEDSLFVPM